MSRIVASRLALVGTIAYGATIGLLGMLDSTAITIVAVIGGVIVALAWIAVRWAPKDT